jgi:hypothetical protein
LVVALGALALSSKSAAEQQKALEDSVSKTTAAIAEQRKEAEILSAIQDPIFAAQLGGISVEAAGAARQSGRARIVELQKERREIRGFAKEGSALAGARARSPRALEIEAEIQQIRDADKKLEQFLQRRIKIEGQGKGQGGAAAKLPVTKAGKPDPREFGEFTLSGGEKQRFIKGSGAASTAQIERLKAQEEQLGKEIELAEKMRAVTVDLNKQKNDAMMEADRERFDATVAQNAKEKGEFEKINSEMESRAKARNDKMKAQVEAFGGAGTEAFVRLAAGQKEAGLAIISGIGDQMVAEGSRAIFTGGISLLTGNPAGAAVAALGAAEVAAGLTLGAAIAPPGGAAGGGGSSRTAAEPTRFRASTDTDGPTNVTVNMPTVLRPTYEDGKQMQKAWREVEIREGAGARLGSTRSPPTIPTAPRARCSGGTT